MLFRSEEGDACLIPAPYYAAFENDMSVVAGIVPFAVHMMNPTQGPTASELDAAYIEAKSVRNAYNCEHFLLCLFTITNAMHCALIVLFLRFK